MDDGFRKNDFAYLKVYLFILKYLDLLNPPPDAHILENIDGDVDDRRFTRSLAQLHLTNYYNQISSIH